MRLPFSDATTQHASRRSALTSAAVAFAAATSSIPLPAFSACSYAEVKALPDTLTEINNKGLRQDLKGAKAMLSGDPLLADFSATVNACGGAETEQKQAVKMLTALREELDYQVGKGVIDPRFGMDPDDALDLQVAMKGASMAMQRYVASVPAP